MTIIETILAYLAYGDEDPEDEISCVTCGHVACTCVFDEGCDEEANAC
jgi:hypothetical protein